MDVVIPCHEKDARTLELVIQGIKQNCKDIRRVIVVSAKRLTDNAEWFPERKYPFGKADIPPILFKTHMNKMREYVAYRFNKIGWIYQQLLKLYAPLVIPGISAHVLVLDADTIFLSPVEFIDDDGRALYNVGTEFYKPYFAHMQRLLPGLTKVFADYSGVCHHMLMQRHVIEDLFKDILEKHGMEPWQALCACIDFNTIYSSSMSEYEIYFNYIFARQNKYAVAVRPLLFKDLKFVDQKCFEQDIQELRTAGYKYVSCHSWLG